MNANEWLEKQVSDVNGLFKQKESLYRKAADCCGLNYNVMLVFYTLLELGRPCTQAEICEYRQMNKQTVHSTVKQLMKDGYIKMEVSPSNKKNKIITITDKGRELANNKIAPILDAELVAVKTLTDSERMTFISLLDKYCYIFCVEMEKAFQSIQEN